MATRDASRLAVIRALVVDDEPIARRRILRLLREEPDIVVLAECGSGAEALIAIRRHAPNLLFLDVQMPEIDGFGVLDAIAAEPLPEVVFVTAYDEFAIRAFDVHALDYLLKPFSEERFHQALHRARERLLAQPAPDPRLDALLEAWRAGPAAPREAYLERIMVKTGGRFLFLRVDEIAWMEAEGNYVRLHVESRGYLIRDTIKRLDARLDPRRFLRIHRSTIVNLDHVREMRPWFGGDHIMVLQDGTELKVSRAYRDMLPDRRPEPGGG